MDKKTYSEKLYEVFEDIDYCSSGSEESKKDKKPEIKSALKKSKGLKGRKRK